MEKGRRDSETSSSTRSHDAKSSRFLDSVQGMFPSYDSLGSYEESKQIRLPAANKNIASQRRTREGKAWALAYEGKNYGEQQEDTELSSPFLVYMGNKECSFPGKRNDFEGEMAAFESAAQTVSNRVNTKTLDKQYEKRENLTNGPVEKKRKEDALAEDDHTGNRPKERESYWERRKKNNASAKKSRDARKARELEAQMKAAFLERENLRIHAQLMLAQEENDCLKRVLCAKM